MKFVFIIFSLFSQPFFSQINNIGLLDHWYKDGLPSTSDGESIFNDVWGLEIQSDKYAIIGSTMGTHILKIEDNKFIEIDFVEGKYAGVQAVHRDYHDYNGYLYSVCDENASSLQIMDLSYLPDSVHLVYDSDSLIVRAHNIFIDTANAKLYACAVATPSGFHALNVYDLFNPVSPTLIYSYDQVSHVHDAYVYNDTAYLNCGNDGLRVIKSLSQGIAYELAELTSYPDKGYNHSGWISGDKKTYIMCDETPSMDIKVLDVSNLNNITVTSTFSSNSYEQTLPHNVILVNNVAYVSYYNDGLQIFDVTNSYNPKKIGYYDTYPGSDNLIFRGMWGVYPFNSNNMVLGSDRTTGLYLFDFEVPPITVNNPFNIFPNPASNYVYFYRNHVDEADYSINIYDVLGSKVDELYSTTDHLKIDLTNYKSGIYIVEYVSNIEDFTLTTKFFVK